MSGTAPGQLPTNGGYAGTQGFQALVNQYAALDGLVRQVIAGKAFAGPVKVINVHGGGPNSTPTVDVQPQVNQVDGLGNPTPHGIIKGMAVFRLQAGVAGIIVDPVAGDIGDAIICDRDISTVAATKGQSNPGSFRTNSWSDGVFFGSLFGGILTTYIQVLAGGVNIITTGTLTFSATNATLDGSGNLTVKGDITAGAGGADSVTLQHHEHSNVTTGGGVSGPPVPGT
jgi:hypothetical protein